MGDENLVYQSLIEKLREIGLLASISSVLGWDEQTQMPPKGAEHRARQSTLLAGMIHERFTSPKMGEWLDLLEQSSLMADPRSDAATNIRETRRSYNRAVRLPKTLVEELASTAVLSQQVWAEARAESNFAKFAPWLSKTVKLKQQEAACVSNGGDLYDALLEEFEPGETAEALARTFAELRPPLVELIGKVVGSGRKPSVDAMARPYSPATQEILGREVASAIGFDFSAGRLDVSVHPFSTELGPGDIRMTTRYAAEHFGDAFFGVLHESGHSLYSQGLPAEHYGTPRGKAISMGIHESQSRLWENLVGRSVPFWNYILPRVRELFPESLAGVSEADWMFSVNKIEPSLIRVEADEATYNLHIMLRFELERALLSGQLPVADLPTVWREKMREYLGVEPSNDAQGCLQDTHWSGGAIGYFPTYTLGNLYASQFFEQAMADLGDLPGQLSRGEFAPLLGWLREKIHCHGQRFTGPELIRRVTGRPLSAEPLLRHLRQKAATYYRIG